MQVRASVCAVFLTLILCTHSYIVPGIGRRVFSSGSSVCRYDTSNTRGMRQSSRLYMAPAVVKAARSLRVFSDKLIASSTALALMSVSKFLDLRSSTIIGGLLAGSLHAVTGPDHIAALLPASIGQRWYTGLRIGAAWGSGHGFSAMLIGLFAFVLKDRISHQFHIFEKLSSVAESAVGVSLLLIGAVGLKETLIDKAGGGDGEEDPILSLKSNSAIFSNGVLHGLSWDGFPSLVPTLTMPTIRSVMVFLVSYCIGTMIAMSSTAAIVGEGSLHLGKITKNPNLPRNLSIVTSILAILIGIFWIVQALK